MAEKHGGALDGGALAFKSDPSDGVTATTTASDLDDDISVTSTVYPDEAEDHEYEVDDILCEEEDGDGDGVMKYLVRWKGYPLEMCTWEPRENFTDEVLEDIWEQKKRQPGFQPFDLGMLDEAQRAKGLRHLRRNRKRRQLGLPETSPLLEAVPDQDLLITDSTAEAAAAAVPVPSLVLASTELPESTEIIDSDEDVVVLDAISAPPSQKKKKKKRKSIDLTAEDSATAAPKKKKSKEDKDKGKGKGKGAESTADKGKGKEPTKKKSSLPAPKPATSAGAATDPKGKVLEKRTSTDRPPKTAFGSFSEKLAASKLGKPKQQGITTAKEPSAAKTSSSSAGATASSSSNAPAAARGAKPVAKKSGVTSQGAGGNAFSGGKRSRAGRTSLIAVATDPNKPQQLFEHISTIRRVELMERDKPDRAIEPSQLKSALFPITGGPPPRSANSSMPSRPSLKKPGSSDDGPRKRKWVRFASVDSETGPVLGNARLKSPPASERDVIGENDVEEDTVMHDPVPDEAPAQPAQPAQVLLPSVALKLLFGTQTEPADATLDVVAHNGSTQQLLDQIFAVRTLRFGYSFLAATLQNQLDGIRDNYLFSGNIRQPETAGATPSSSASVLQMVSQRLKLMASGLILVRPDHAVLVYPTQCDDWIESQVGFPLPPAGTDPTVSLRYVVFSTGMDCAALLRPPGDEQASFGASPGDQDRRQLMQQFFQLDKKAFDDLLPNEPRRPKVKAPPTRFFLAFPPTTKPFMYQMATWLRDMDADCIIMFSTNPGAWMAFLHDVANEKMPGVVLVHELVTGALRQFPYFHKLVYPGTWNCRVWSLSQGTYASPIFYPINGSIDDVPAPIGRISWTELFPDGLAILLTPSAILADPSFVLAILRWASAAARHGRAPVTLVAAWDLCSYMREVADDKWRLLEEMQRGPVKPDYRSTLRVGALPKHCLHRDEAWALACELCDMDGQKALAALRGPGWPRAITLADPAIDPNDEQSLVCWFGWWSTLYMDQYRAFFVLGTERKSGSLDIMSRKIRVPNFASPAASGPETRPPDTWIPEPRESTWAPGPSAAKLDSTADTAAQPAATKPRRTSRTDSITTAPRTVTARRHPVQPLNLYSAKLLEWNRHKNFWKIFGYVVWWRDADESYRNGFMDSTNHTIQDWMRYTWPFSLVHRSYIGLFNLADVADDGNAAASHPFVAVWRPVMPHVQHLHKDETELVFWDAHAGERFSGRDKLYEQDDLTSGQLAVVDYLRQHGSEKNPGTHLAKIWINSRARGWVEEPTSPTYNAMDRTMAFLESLADDFKFVMPPTPAYMTSLGYKQLNSGRRGTDGSSGTGAGAGAGAGAGDGAGTGTAAGTAASLPAKTSKVASSTHEPSRTVAPTNDSKGASTRGTRGKRDNNPQPVRMVFQPPGSSPPGPTAMQYQNNLYESTQAHKKRDPNATEMAYEFRPTMEWYRDLLEEGLGFEHVVVEKAEAVCLRFGIARPAV